MSNFIQTMRDWKRMCKSMGQEDEYSACDKCKLRSFECPPIYERECDGADWGLVEKVVTAWAAENPEPKYPSWAEWLISIGAFGSLKETEHDYTKTEILYRMRDMMFEPIPAEIAEKFGIEPKEHTVKGANIDGMPLDYC